MNDVYSSKNPDKTFNMVSRTILNNKTYLDIYNDNVSWTSNHHIRM